MSHLLRQSCCTWRSVKEPFKANAKKKKKDAKDLQFWLLDKLLSPFSCRYA